MLLNRHFVVLLFAVLSLAGNGCATYVRKSDFDSMIGELRDDSDRQQQEIDALSLQVQQVFFVDNVEPSHFYDRTYADTICHFTPGSTTLQKRDNRSLVSFSEIDFRDFSSYSGGARDFWR